MKSENFFRNNLGDCKRLSRNNLCDGERLSWDNLCDCERLSWNNLSDGKKYRQAKKEKHSMVFNTKIFGLRAEGSISVYMIMMLVLVLVLVCTLIESARVSTVKASLRNITYMGMDSVFSEYAAPVYDDYGIMLLWCDEDGVRDKLESYIEENLDASGKGFLKSTDLCAARLKNIEVQDIEWAVSENGQGFEEQIYDYMKYRMAQNAAEELLSDYKIFDSGNKVKKFVEKINSFAGEITKTQKAVIKIREKFSEITNLSEKTINILGDMKNSSEEFLKTKDISCIEEMADNVKNLKSAQNDISKFAEDIEDLGSNYDEISVQLKEELSGLKQELETEKGEYDEESYKVIKEEIEKIENAESSSNMVGSENGSSVKEKLEAAKDLNEKADSLNGLYPMLEEEDIADNMQNVSELLSKLKSDFEETDYSKLTETETGAVPEANAADISFISEIGKILDEGVLNYVAEDVSEKTVDMSDFPSRVYKNTMQDSGNDKEKADDSDEDDESVLTATSQKVMLSEYILCHMENYTNASGENALDYEAEYIISGKASDKENLASTAKKLILIKAGCNMISILKDGEKRSEAALLAAAVATAVGFPQAEQIVELLILSAWSLAEAVVDVKTLLSGGKVPIIKKGDEWSLSLTGLKNFTGSESSGKSFENGLDYEAYLRALLLIKNRQTQLLRIMDVIQANMRLKENDTFRIKDCVLKTQITAEYTTGRIFVTFPFVSRNMQTGGGFRFSLEQEYGY